jgi:hypothetical protein
MLLKKFIIKLNLLYRWAQGKSAAWRKVGHAAQRSGQSHAKAHCTPGLLAQKW